MILSVPWYMFNGIEHTAILSHSLTFITGSSSDYCASDFLQQQPNTNNTAPSIGTIFSMNASRR